MNTDSRKISQTGKIVAIYGINNLGKTVQANKLADRIKKETSRECLYIKYPIYELKPTGPIINDYLRRGNPLGIKTNEFQIIHAMNRLGYQGNISSMIKEGKHFVVEDYIGTSLAWGMGTDANIPLIRELNSELIEPDLSILIDGERFTESIEKNHLHETNDDLVNKVRSSHQHLAKEFGWKTINANQPIDKVHSDIWSLVKDIF